MKTLNFSAVQTKLTSVINSTSEDGLQELLAHVVYHALVHGNAPLKSLAALRNSKAPAQFKAAMGKYMPVKYVKAQGDRDGHYIYDGKKALELRLEFSVVASGVTGQEPSTVEYIDSVLPRIFTKAERKAVVFDADTSVQRLFDKLNANGLTEEAAAIMSAYNGVKIARTVQAIAA